MIAVGCGDGTVHFINPADLTELEQPLRVHDRKVTVVCFHPTRPLFATASEDLTIRIWDRNERRLVAEILGPVFAPIRLRFDPSGDTLGSVGRFLRVWSMEGVLPSRPEQEPSME